MKDDEVDRLARTYRTQLGEAPPAVTDAAAAAFRARGRAAAWDLSRALLVLAGAAGLALDIPVLLGGAQHTSVDVAVLHSALALGFLLAAWRPLRYARGLAPVAMAAAVMLLLPTGADAGVISRGLAEELSHMPVLVGAVTLALSGWLVPQGHRQRA